MLEAAGSLEYAGQFDAARAHVVDVGLRAGVAVLEGPLLLGLAPEDLVVAVAVERRIDVDQVHALIRQLLDLVEAVAAIDDPRIQKGGRAHGGGLAYSCLGFTTLGTALLGSGGFGGRPFGRGRFAGHGDLVYARRPARAKASNARISDLRAGIS